MWSVRAERVLRCRILRLSRRAAGWNVQTRKVQQTMTRSNPGHAPGFQTWLQACTVRMLRKTMKFAMLTTFLTNGCPHGPFRLMWVRKWWLKQNAKRWRDSREWRCTVLSQENPWKGTKKGKWSASNGSSQKKGTEEHPIAKARMVVREFITGDKHAELFAGTPGLMAMRTVISRAMTRCLSLTQGVWTWDTRHSSLRTRGWFAVHRCTRRSVVVESPIAGGVRTGNQVDGWWWWWYGEEGCLPRWDTGMEWGRSGCSTRSETCAITVATVGYGNCKDNTSKDPFSRCEICKNLGYRLSGRSQRQEHYWRHEAQHETQQCVQRHSKHLGNTWACAWCCSLRSQSLFCCCHTQPLHIAHWLKMFVFASHSIPSSSPCRMHELSVLSDFLDLFINFTFLLLFIFIFQHWRSTSLRLRSK